MLSLFNQIVRTFALVCNLIRGNWIVEKSILLDKFDPIIWLDILDKYMQVHKGIHCVLLLCYIYVRTTILLCSYYDD